ncbi:hypothetical protein LguiB_010627 [Lonicera macranthoides]
MASEEDHTVYGEEDLDEEEDEDESEEEDLNLTNHPPPEDDDDDDVDVDDDSTSSSNVAAGDGNKVTIAVAGAGANGQAMTTQSRLAVCATVPDPKHRIEEVSPITATVVEEKKPLAALDESRRLFQRLWTDEDEILLLQGFLDYNNQRGTNSSSHHHDTTAFYDQIKCKLQLDFNKNQLVEKLRRLKKKYRNVLSKIDSGKEYVFKSPHDQATFEISRKIWSNSASGSAAGGSGGAIGVPDGGLDDFEGNHNHIHNPNPNLNDLNSNGIDANSSEKKTPRSRKRSRVVKTEEKPTFNQQSHHQQVPVAAVPVTAAANIPNLVEDTVRSCLSPLFKELIHNAMNGNVTGASRGFAGVAMNPMPMNLGGTMNFAGGDMVDEKWRKQHILELEVYSKRLELVQDQIKSQLEELRSMGS